MGYSTFNNEFMKILLGSGPSNEIIMCMKVVWATTPLVWLFSLLMFWRILSASDENGVNPFWATCVLIVFGAGVTCYVISHLNANMMLQVLAGVASAFLSAAASGICVHKYREEYSP